MSPGHCVLKATSLLTLLWGKIKMREKIIHERIPTETASLHLGRPMGKTDRREVAELPGPAQDPPSQRSEAPGRAWAPLRREPSGWSAGALLRLPVQARFSVPALPSSARLQGPLACCREHTSCSTQKDRCLQRRISTESFTEHRHKKSLTFSNQLKNNWG